MRIVKLLLAMLTVILTTQCIAAGNLPIGPHPYILTTPQGYFGLKFLPDMQKPLRPPTCILFSLQPNGREHIAWKRRLINDPQRITIQDTFMEPFVYTLGTMYSDSYAHFLVIYNSQGKVVGDFNLEDLATPDEIAKFPSHQDALKWMYGAEYQITGSVSELVIHLKSGRGIKINGWTGKIE